MKPKTITKLKEITKHSVYLMIIMYLGLGALYIGIGVVIMDNPIELERLMNVIRLGGLIVVPLITAMIFGILYWIYFSKKP